LTQVAAAKKPERGCVVLDQPQTPNETKLSRGSNAKTQSRRRKKKQPGGLTAISRCLAQATPPVNDSKTTAPRKGVPADEPPRRNPSAPTLSSTNRRFLSSSLNEDPCNTKERSAAFWQLSAVNALPRLVVATQPRFDKWPTRNHTALSAQPLFSLRHDEKEIMLPTRKNCGRPLKPFVLDGLYRESCAVSSVVEHFLDTEGVRGSNPLSRTIYLGQI
jgi:hypothetical protein